MKKIYFSFIIALTMALSPQAATVTVDVGNNFFSPDNFSISVGDTIVWVFVAGNHTTTSTTIPVGANPWDELINPNNLMYSYVVTMAGNYSYQCTFHFTMGMIGQFTAVESSGINEGIAGISLNLYANPVSKVLQVDLKTTGSGVMQMGLNDITGREVRILASAQQSAGEHHFEYDISDLPKGLYLLKLNIDENEMVRKIIIQ